MGINIGIYIADIRYAIWSYSFQYQIIPISSWLWYQIWNWLIWYQFSQTWINLIFRIIDKYHHYLKNYLDSNIGYQISQEMLVRYWRWIKKNFYPADTSLKGDLSIDLVLDPCSISWDSLFKDIVIFLTLRCCSSKWPRVIFIYSAHAHKLYFVSCCRILK